MWLLAQVQRNRADHTGVRRLRNVEQLERDLVLARRRIAELEAARERDAGHDHVTGLLSLRAFRAQLEIEVERARRHGRPLAVALLDVDGFRDLNSHYGHVRGDAVLSEVARVLAQHTRSHDVVSRMGNDEFSMLLPETEVEGALQCFTRVLSELETLRAGDVQGLSASVGIAVFERGQSPAQLLGRAGDALNAARAAGGGRAMVSGPGEDPVGSKAAVQRDVVEALAATLLERDRYTGEHSESVVDMAGAVAHRLGLDEAEVSRVRAAALLHDIGKVAIPDHILNKQAKLDDQEWVLMREHPVIGWRILKAIPGLGGVARIVRHEHESFDGSGYPDGLAGRDIPVGSRIILACDAYHAMITDRPYRAGMSHAEAIQELARCAGTQFDPDVTGVLIGYLHGRRQGGLAA